VKIYTKTGDDGLTGLVGGARVEKDGARIAAIGEVDELNAAIGICRTQSRHTELDAALEDIQNRLFDVGAELASPDREQHQSIGEKQIRALEQSMDIQTERLEPLRAFILPAGSELAARLHYARAVCRRAERAVLSLRRSEQVRSDVTIYLNRLSDWLFVAARTANRLQGVEDVKWKKTEG
jgi:cob(I)alamin adenosyltransferase